MLLIDSMTEIAGGNNPGWEAPPWEGDPVKEVTELLGSMTSEQRAKLLLEFPADEVIAVADMLQNLDPNQ